MLKGEGEVGETVSYVGHRDAQTLFFVYALIKQPLPLNTTYATRKRGRNSLNNKMLGRVLVGSEGDLLHDALNHRVQPSRADVFDRRIHL